MWVCFHLIQFFMDFGRDWALNFEQYVVSLFSHSHERVWRKWHWFEVSNLKSKYVQNVFSENNSLFFLLFFSPVHYVIILKLRILSSYFYHNFLLEQANEMELSGSIPKIKRKAQFLFCHCLQVVVLYQRAYSRTPWPESTLLSFLCSKQKTTSKQRLK